MGQIIWIMAGAAAVGAVIGLTSLNNQEQVSADPDLVAASNLDADGEPIVEEVGSVGRALSAAAFGLAALQPDTYNGELVIEIIDASHLDEAEKSELVAELAAAEAGRADLDTVLEDVRVALAVE